MSVEIVIPSLRQSEPERLVWSLALQTRPPDVVTVVSNETAPFPGYGAHARLMRFSSTEYGVGERDVALRQNVGIYSSQCDVVVIQGDDQIAPPTMIEDVLKALEGSDHVWGNHRLTDFTVHTKEQIREMPMSEGDSRENPTPPAWHGHWSCYGGMFAAKTGMLQDIGGFDMAFNGRHAGEDQALGFRLMRRDGQTQVEIAEPPFSWHSDELKTGGGSAQRTWLEPMPNGCGRDNHVFIGAMIDEVPYLQCDRCPVWHFGHVDSLFREKVLIRYRPELVQTTSVWL